MLVGTPSYSPILMSMMVCTCPDGGGFLLGLPPHLDGTEKGGYTMCGKAVIGLGLGLGPAQRSADGKDRPVVQQGLDLSRVKQRTSVEY